MQEKTKYKKPNNETRISNVPIAAQRGFYLDLCLIFRRFLLSLLIRFFFHWIAKESGIRAK